MLLMRIIVPVLVVGLMSVSAGVAFGDSDGDGGNATTTEDGLDPNATSSDPGLDPNATSSDPGLDPNATSSDPGLDPNATSTDDGTGGDGERRKAFVGVISGFATSTVGYSITLTQKGTGEPVCRRTGNRRIHCRKRSS